MLRDILPEEVVDKDWWRGAVIYQIYPRSYQDSNGDGIGDLAGITKRIPYIASLGVDAVWISPFFTSPMKDFGYDVSNYCDVDPMFGSLSDFDLLVEVAQSHGLKVMIDLVLSHTSDQHPWFQESRASRTGHKADWYVWADPKPDGSPPNNWLSVFGGPAWQWDPRREQYYLHNFLTSQPDLNFHTPAVQDALLNVARFWLERGVDGFRLDTINFYFADKKLRNNPALPKAKRNASIAPSVNPYNHQEHIYSKNRPENLAFLARFRSLLDLYPAATCVGEVGDAQRGLELLGEYTSGEKGAHMCYAFEFLGPEPLSAASVLKVIERLEDAGPEGWACWALSNHDVVRHATRWGLSDEAQRCYITLMGALRGSLCLYQGEELGLPEADIGFNDLQDPYGVEFWPEFKGRDGCRTPMVWDGTKQGGFTKGAPWLPVSKAHQKLSVEAQENNPSSILHHYRRVLSFRRSLPALRKGGQMNMKVEGQVLRFSRVLDGQVVCCIFNLSDKPVPVLMPFGYWTHIGKDLGAAVSNSSGQMMLDPWQVSFAVKR